MNFRFWIHYKDQRRGAVLALPLFEQQRTELCGSSVIFRGYPLHALFETVQFSSNVGAGDYRVGETLTDAPREAISLAGHTPASLVLGGSR